MLRISLPAVTVTKTTIQCVALTEDPMATSAWLSASKTNTLKKKKRIIRYYYIKHYNAAYCFRGIRVLSEGECPRPQVCTSDYMPVCGADSVTYGNACGARAA